MIPSSGTPFGSSSCDSLRGASDHRWSYPQSISNSSVHTTSTNHDIGLSSRDSLPLITSGPYRNQNFNVSDPKSHDFLEKSSFCLRNESQSSISTVLGPKSNDYTPTPSPKQGTRFSSPQWHSAEDEDESSTLSTPRSSLALSLKTDPIPSFSGPSSPPPRKPSFLSSPPPLDPSVSHHEPHSSLHTSHKPPHPSRRHSVTTTPTVIHGVEPDPFSIAPAIQEYQGLLPNVGLHTAAAAGHRDPFVPTRQTPPPSAVSTRPASKIAAEYHKPSRQSIQEYQDLLSNDNPRTAAAANYKDTFDTSRQAPPPPASSPRRTLKITVEYHKPSRQFIQEYQELLSNVNPRTAAAANYKDPFDPSRQAPPPPTSLHASKPSWGQDPSVSHHKSSSHYSRWRPVTTSPTTIHEVESDPFSPSSRQEECSSSAFPVSKDIPVPQTPLRPSRANTVNIDDLYTDPNPPPVYGTASRSGIVTAKGKKGMLGFMTKFLNLNKRPEISVPYDPARLVHGGFNSITGESTGLSKERQQLLQDSGISKSDQEKNPLALMEVVKFYQEGGSDVWDKMGHAPAPGGSHQPASDRPALSPYQPMQPILDRSISHRIAPQLPRNDTLVRASTIKDQRFPAPLAAVKSGLLSKPQPTPAVNTPITERRAPQLPGVPRRREKKNGAKTNDVDIVKRLRLICTDADPTLLYRNFVKIGQG